jgi:hypothetical protein
VDCGGLASPRCRSLGNKGSQVRAGVRSTEAMTVRRLRPQPNGSWPPVGASFAATLGIGDVANGIRVRSFWAGRVGVGAVESEGSVLEPVQNAGEPTVVPVGSGCQQRVGLLESALPGEPEGGEFFDEFRVLGPAVGDLACQWVAVSQPGGPRALGNWVNWGADRPVLTPHRVGALPLTRASLSAVGSGTPGIP